MNIKLAIHTPEKHQFNHVCEILGLIGFVRFSDNDKIYEFYGHDTCISVKSNKKGLGYSNKSSHEKYNYKIVTYDEFCEFFGIDPEKKDKGKSAEDVLSEIANLISEFPTTATK